MTPAKLMRIGLAVALVGGWLVARWKFPWLLDGIRDWSSHAVARVVGPVGVISGVLLAIAIVVLIWDRFVRLRERHSYDAQLERGTTTALLVFLIVVGLVLALGAVYHSRVIVMGIGYVTIGVSVLLICGLLAEGVKAWRRKRRR
jgi:predicted tellurium resistance membrane protein TerC